MKEFIMEEFKIVRHGEWVEETDYLLEGVFTCSVCGESLVMIEGTPRENEYNYCPFCGAQMEGER